MWCLPGSDSRIYSDLHKPLKTARQTGASRQTPPPERVPRLLSKQKVRLANSTTEQLAHLTLPLMPSDSLIA